MIQLRSIQGFSILRVFFLLALTVPLLGVVAWYYHYEEPRQEEQRDMQKITQQILEEDRLFRESEAGKKYMEELRKKQKLARDTIKDH